MQKHGTFAWNELMTADLEAAKAFYASVAGWTYQDMPMDDGSYTLAFVPGETVPVAGLMAWPADQAGSNDWFAYLAVDDIRSAIQTATVAGGVVEREPFQIPGTGWIAIVSDPAGAMIGFLEPAPMN